MLTISCIHRKKKINRWECMMKKQATVYSKIQTPTGAFILTGAAWFIQDWCWQEICWRMKGVFLLVLMIMSRRILRNAVMKCLKHVVFWQHLCGNVEHLHNLIKVNVTQITNMFLHIQGKHFKLFVASTKIIKDILIRITILVARGQQTGKVYKPNYNRVWSYIPESMAQLIAENRIVFPEDTSKIPMKKRFKRQSWPVKILLLFLWHSKVCFRAV